MLEKDTSQSVQSVERILDLLELLTTYKDGLPLSLLSQYADLKPSTAHRLLQTLLHRGCVKQDAASKVYSLGPRMLAMGNAYLDGCNLYSEAMPVLERIVGECNETAHLAVFSGSRIVISATVDSTQAVRAHVEVLERRHVHASALGKVLLSEQSASFVAEFVAEGGLPRITSRTITTFTGLQQELVRVREQGYAIDDEEMAEGLCCVGTPVRDYRGKLTGAISIAVPRQRFGAERVPLLIELVTEGAGTISRALGYSPQPQQYDCRGA